MYKNLRKAKWRWEENERYRFPDAGNRSNAATWLDETFQNWARNWRTTPPAAFRTKIKEVVQTINYWSYKSKWGWRKQRFLLSLTVLLSLSALFYESDRLDLFGKRNRGEIFVEKILPYFYFFFFRVEFSVSARVTKGETAENRLRSLHSCSTFSSTLKPPP